MNPILNQVQSNQIQGLADQTSSLASAYQSFQKAGNPYQAFISMARNNPQYMTVMNMLKKGMTPEAIARGMMKQRGINPEEFLGALQGRK